MKNRLKGLSLKNELTDEKGVVLELSAFILLALGFLVAFVINIGVLLLNRQEVQGAADAAVRAAVISGGKAGTYKNDEVLILDKDIADKAADKTLEVCERSGEFTNIKKIYIKDEDHNDNHNEENYNKGLYNVKVTFMRNNLMNVFPTKEISIKSESTAQARVYQVTIPDADTSQTIK